MYHEVIPLSLMLSRVDIFFKESNSLFPTQNADSILRKNTCD